MSEPAAECPCNTKRAQASIDTILPPDGEIAVDACWMWGVGMRIIDPNRGEIITQLTTEQARELVTAITAAADASDAGWTE